MNKSASSFLLLLLSPLLTGANSAVATASVHTRMQAGLEHEDVTIDGWVLDEVYVYHPHPEERNLMALTRRKLSFNDHPHLAPESRRRRLDNKDAEGFTPTNIHDEISAVDASGDLTRAKVRGLAKINFANQDHDWKYFQYSSYTNPIAKSGDMFYTENTTEKIEGEKYPSPSNEITIRFQKMITAEINATAADIGIRRYDTSDETWTAKDEAEEESIGGAGPRSIARRKMGIACVKFTHGKDVVLAFRDTESAGDETNIAAWITSSIADMNAEGGMTQTMKRQWTEVAELEWGDVHKERAAAGSFRDSNTYYKSVVQAGMYVHGATSNFVKDLAKLSNDAHIGGDGDAVKLTAEEVAQQGYWPITKQVIEQVRSDLPSGGRLLFTGYSQGGGRAQLSRMYTELKYQETWPVVTFAAVGAACFPRNLDGKGRTDLLDDMDPYYYYENVTDYQNVFDPWGAALGKDIGDSCQLGTINVKETRAYKWCKDIYGYTGPKLVGGGIALGRQPLKDQFARCRYVAHGLQGIMSVMQNDDELLEDGSAAGGCFAYSGWEKDSGKCPVQSFELAAGIIAIIIVSSTLFVFAIGGIVCRYFRCCCYKKKNCLCKPYATLNSIGEVEVGEKK